MLGFYVINQNSLILAQWIQQCPNPALAKSSTGDPDEHRHTMSNYQGQCPLACTCPLSQCWTLC